MRRFETHKPVCDVLWSLWGFFQTTNGNKNPAPGEDFFAYAAGRHERCKIRLSEPKSAERLSG